MRKRTIMGQVQSIEKRSDKKCLLRSDLDYCGIFGCIVLPSGNVIITDFYNRKVKTVNVDTGEVICSFMLTSGPSDVASIGETKVAVTLTDERKLQLLHVTEFDTYISLDYRIKVDGHCMGIDYDNDTFVVSFVNPPQVQLIHKDGIVLKTIVTDPSGYFIFRRPQSVCFSRDRNHFYCCDSENYEVMKIRRGDGQVVARNREIRQPTGVIELPDDNILVVGGDTNAVHVLPPDCKVQTTVLSAKDGIGRPRALCLRQKGNRLFDLIISNQNGSILSQYRVLFHSRRGLFDITKYM
ncbi:uncharacterized protein LOC123540920 [Mercenaria mercenaria]|uniref:uncharacterized protein LOC123540920 n=1 Tax=Mercenaria mercenaria TaxID=6596 RepID=UPI00234EEFB7|nr:uncharacterized protein LOC123540920 [Mercenaria mercenaria]XP_045182185.2 uncharacterized protein LOC123540920 [Mercenaria mercenaria]